MTLSIFYIHAKIQGPFQLGYSKLIHMIFNKFSLSISLYSHFKTYLKTQIEQGKGVRAQLSTNMCPTPTKIYTFRNAKQSNIPNGEKHRGR